MRRSSGAFAARGSEGSGGSAVGGRRKGRGSAVGARSAVVVRTTSTVKEGSEFLKYVLSPLARPLVSLERATRRGR